MPITLHVGALQVAGLEGNLAGIAGKGVGRLAAHGVFRMKLVLQYAVGIWSNLTG